jgi:hypothetical protein
MVVEIAASASWSNPTIASHEPGTAPGQSTNQQPASNLPESLVSRRPLDTLPEVWAINSLRRNSRARFRSVPTIVNHQEPVLILGSALSLCTKQSFANLLVQEAAPCLGSAWHGFASSPCTRQIDSLRWHHRAQRASRCPSHTASHCLPWNKRASKHHLRRVSANGGPDGVGSGSLIRKQHPVGRRLKCPALAYISEPILSMGSAQVTIPQSAGWRDVGAGCNGGVSVTQLISCRPELDPGRGSSQEVWSGGAAPSPPPQTPRTGKNKGLIITEIWGRPRRSALSRYLLIKHGALGPTERASVGRSVLNAHDWPRRSVSQHSDDRGPDRTRRRRGIRRCLPSRSGAGARSTSATRTASFV